MKTWQGVIVVAYIRSPQRILLIENTKRQKVTLLSGAVEPEDGGSLVKAAVRELHEEVGWRVAETALIPTNLYHQFIYAADKPGRGGDNGSNRVFLLDASDMTEPLCGEPGFRPRWAAVDEAERLISFDDLKPVLSQTMRLLPNEYA